MKFKFSQLLIFGTIDAFTLVDGESDDRLIVFNRGEGSFLDARDGSVSRYDFH
jgi:hypothetical protein